MTARRRVLLAMECTIGGTRRHLGQLALGLPRDRYDVTVVASAERDATFRDDLAAIRRAGIEAIELPMVRPIDRRRDLAHYRELRRVVREGRFDIVHSHSSKAGVLGRAASLREGIGRRVYTPHTFSFAFTAGFSRPKRALFYGVELALGRATHRMICVSPSEAVQARSLHLCAPDRVRVVENGIDPTPYVSAPTRAESRAQLGLAPATRIVLVVGLQNRAKGQVDAVGALARIAPASRPLLLLAGGVSDPAYGREVESRIRALGVDGSVQLLGHRDDVPRLLAAADVVLSPSRWEGMPYAVLEAMAAERAVLATATNGARDAVVHGETGIVVPVGDLGALAREMESLAADPGRARSLGEAGRARVLERYTLARMIEKTAAVYDEAIDA
ncbi:MAG TPA: glycosyltransferase family 4 protein [Planctomycetota bacterium]|nr:glycosyltransferase family 4 protein [Planctomycetota bacterium]